MAKLGTHKRPAVIRVQSTEEAEQIVGMAQERGWKVIVGVEPDQIEDLSDLRKLMRTEAEPEVKSRLPPRISGNDYCPCRSGKKFKKCCGAAIASPGGMKKVSLITDGSCLGNPGPGGWACVLRFGGVKKEFFGFDPRTTNNRMELMAPIQGLLALKEPCEVEITTDSEYVLYGITKWIIKWKRRHWWRKHEPVRNADLWMELDELASRHKTTWVWTRGHAGHEDNTRCDWLAQNAAATQRSSWADGRPHAPLRLGLGADYVPPKPQAGLFDDVEPGGEDDEDQDEEVQRFG